MNTKLNNKCIAVVSFGNPDDLMFCGVDDQRIVFFNTFRIGELAQIFSDDKVIVSLIRDGKNTDKANSSFVFKMEGMLLLSGFETIRERNKISLDDWKLFEDLSATYFSQGDILEIERNQSEKEKENTWLSLVATKRTYGGEFLKVKNEKPDFFVELAKVFGTTLDGFMNKRVIFENPPKDEGLIKFY